MLQQICNLPQYGISAEEVPLRFIDALRYAPDIVRSQPRTASLLSGYSVLRADFILKSEADSAAGNSNSANALYMIYGSPEVRNLTSGLP